MTPWWNRWRRPEHNAIQFSTDIILECVSKIPEAHFRRIWLHFCVAFALVNKNWTQGTTKTTWQLIKLYTTKFLAILLGGKVIEGIGRALLVEEDHIIIDFLSDRLITGHV